MFTKWLGTRSSHSLKDRSFRPWLESLEERNAPSGGPGPDHDHGPPPPHHPPPPHPGPANNGVQSSVNVSAGDGNHGSFNHSTITGSFNNTVTTTINNIVSVNLMPAQQLAIGGLFSISSALNGMNSQLGTLVADEVALAVDNYLTTPAISSALGLSPSVVGTLNADEAALGAAIAANPLGSTALGHFIGTVASDVTMHALMSAQPTI